jgi:hypothetical protein
MRSLELADTPVGVNENRGIVEDYARLVAVVEAEGAELRGRTYDVAAKLLPKDFQEYYEKKKAEHEEHPFSLAKTAYLVGKSPQGHYQRIVYCALDRARMEVK